MQSNTCNETKFVITFENTIGLTETELKDTLHKLGQVLLEDRKIPSTRECFVTEIKIRKI